MPPARRAATASDRTPTMAEPAWELPDTLLRPDSAGTFPAECRAAPDALLYFLLNVGDGDTQLLLLPERAGRRRAVVVDVATTGKLGRLLESLAAAGLLPPLADAARLFPLVVGAPPAAGGRRPAVPAGRRDPPARGPHRRHAGVPASVRRSGRRVLGARV